MLVTNINNLPAPLVEAVSRPPRERKPNRISVSELIQPPQLRALTLAHDTELVEDAADRIWALLGTLLHQALEKNAIGIKNLISEEKLSINILGWDVVGVYDLSEMILDGELLTDYKLTCLAGGKCLTSEGWKTPDQIKVGDYTLGYVKELEGTVWTRINAVHRLKNAPVLHSSNRSFQVTCTPNHKWITWSRSVYKGKTYRKCSLVETENLKTHHAIQVAAPFKGVQQGFDISDNDAALLGWLVTDGTMRWVGNCILSSIAQSEKKHLAEVSKVVAPYLTSSSRRHWGVHEFRLQSGKMRALCAKLKYKSKDDLPRVVLNMSQSQRGAMHRAMCLAEGYIVNDQTVTFTQKPGPVLEAFKLLCVFLGIRLGVEIKHPTAKNPVHWVRPLCSPFLNTTRPPRQGEKGRQQLFQRRGTLQDDVWCVSTDSGTFTAEANGVAFLTGNSVWAVKEGVKPEWEAQLNIYAQLIRHAGRNVDQLQIVAIGRDWSKNKAKFDSTYPQQQVKVIAVPLWTEAETLDYITERVKLHQEAQKGTWPECSPDERWARPTQWAVTKQGQKKAVKLYESQKLADLHVANSPALYVVERPGESVRCVSYCSVKPFCAQAKRMGIA